VDPNRRNNSKHLAKDYLPAEETQSHEVLRMAMYNKGTQAYLIDYNGCLQLIKSNVSVLKNCG
jgi:hypothetical protein